MTSRTGGLFPRKFTLTIEEHPTLGWIITSDAHKGFEWTVMPEEGLPEGLRQVPGALRQILVAQMDADRAKAESMADPTHEQVLAAFSTALARAEDLALEQAGENKRLRAELAAAKADIAMLIQKATDAVDGVDAGALLSNSMTETTVTPFQRPQPRSYEAKLFKVLASGLEVHVAGTLDGFIDFAVIESDGAHRTYNLTCNDARALAAALNSGASDVQANCLFDRDPLLAPERD